MSLTHVDRAFAALASTKALETVQAAGSQYNAIVEEDEMVSVQGSSS